MSFSIINWNISENIVWYVRLADTGSAVLVELYLTEADAEAQTNLQASGESAGYGSSLEVTLTNEEDASAPVSIFQAGYDWHLVVAGQNGDETKIFRIREFVDLDEIAHSAYRNSLLVEARATAEINAHTHARITRTVLLGSHLPQIEPGDILGLDSDRRGINDLSQVFEHRIAGTFNSLVSELDAIKFLGLKR
jgi:hypothetical protein